jgi:hypothetical protein
MKRLLIAEDNDSNYILMTYILKKVMLMLKLGKMELIFLLNLKITTQKL